MSETTVIKALANAFLVMEAGNPAHVARWNDILDDIEENLPSGSGFDCGTKIDRERSTSERIILSTSFHHMNDVGMYDGWTEHEIRIVPSLFLGFEIKVGGRDRNQIKEYIADTFYEAMLAPYTYPAVETKVSA